MICQYKALILDMYGVIIEESKGNLLSYACSCFPKDGQERIGNIIKKGLFEKASMGLISTAELMAEIGFDNPTLAVEEYVENYLTLDKEFISFAEKAREKYELVLLSNDLSDFSRHITKHFGLDEFFAREIISADVKCRKPSLEIFDMTIEAIDKKPSECIFVDNRPENLIAAEEVGISAVLFNRDNQSFDGMTVCSFKELWDIIG